MVVRNAPLLHDGTPMPTRYWLTGRDVLRHVSRLEAAGGVRPRKPRYRPTRSPQPMRATKPTQAAMPADWAGPRPHGGVGGTRLGVKCLHAHYAHHLAGGDDPVGRWVAELLAQEDAG